MGGSTHSWLLTAHVVAVSLSVASFASRGALMFARSPLLGARLVRVLPHVIDTVLLGTAIALMVTTRQYPLEQSWLTAKLLALVGYIGFGTVAIRRGRTMTLRGAAFACALVCVAYAAATALHHDANPLHWL